MKFQHSIAGLTLAAALMFSATMASASGNAYKVDGAVSGEYKKAKCSLYFNKYGKVWTLKLTPEKEYEPGANLFFSPKFGAAATGEYPVKFDFRNAAATLGGSVTNGMDTYSNDTQGSVTFERFDDRVTGQFSYSVADRKDRSVSASGSFDCPRGEALK